MSMVCPWLAVRVWISCQSGPMDLQTHGPNHGRDHGWDRGGGVRETTFPVILTTLISRGVSRGAGGGRAWSLYATPPSPPSFER